jgi:hypothetical protein
MNFTKLFRIFNSKTHVPLINCHVFHTFYVILRANLHTALTLMHILRDDDFFFDESLEGQLQIIFVKSVTQNTKLHLCHCRAVNCGTR